MTTIEVGKFYKSERLQKVEVVAIRPPQVFGLVQDPHFDKLLEACEEKLDYAKLHWTPWRKEPAIPWDSVPDWCQWWAVDQDGAQWFYGNKPDPEGSAWFCGMYPNGILCLPKNRRIPYTGDWRESLRQRPGKEGK
jgi:hypothetical protein